MDLVDRGPIRVVGVVVEAPFARLGVEVPAGWERVRARAAELPPAPYIEVSTDLGTGSYREVLGAQVPPGYGVPDGMEAVDLPAARYVHEVHRGPVEEIDVTFARMLGFASQVGVAPDGVKLDVGYGTDGPHALFVRYAVL